MIKLEESRYGTPRPMFYVAAAFVTAAKRRPQGHREIAAAVYQLAAQIEEASAKAGATWVVVPEPHDARVVLELANGTRVEADAGMDLLRDVERA